MFIRCKRTKGRVYYQVVSNRREGRKIKQKVEAYLGKHKTIAEAIAPLELECHAEDKKRLEVYRRQRVATSPSAQAEIERSYEREKALKRRIEKLKALAERL